MKKVYISLLIMSIILFLVSPVIFAEPNTNLSILLYSEDKEDTATHLKLYASDEITPNKNIIYSIVITASVPSPLGQGNVIDQGLTALVVPETAEVDYQNIKVYGASTPDSNKYVEYQPENKSTKELFDILGLIISKIPALGLVMDISPIYQPELQNYETSVDLNQYDIVKTNWKSPRLTYWQKVQIDIPVKFNNDLNISLFAFWQNESFSSDGTGPTFKRDNTTVCNIELEKKKSLNYYQIKDKIAVYYGNKSNREGANSYYKEVCLSTFNIFGLRNCFEINEFNTKVFSIYKGILIDASYLCRWKDPSFKDFIESDKMHAIIEEYVKEGGILIISHSFYTSDSWTGLPIMSGLPDGKILWGNLKYELKHSSMGKNIGVGSNYKFNSSSEIATYIRENLVNYITYPKRFGFKVDKDWEILISGKDDDLPRLIEQRYGKGRILLYAGDISRRILDDPESNNKMCAQNDVFLEAFLDYITKYSQIE